MSEIQGNWQAEGQGDAQSNIDPEQEGAAAQPEQAVPALVPTTNAALIRGMRAFALQRQVGQHQTPEQGRER